MEFTTEPEFDVEELKQRVNDNIRLIYDPEIPVNIYDLGLIYDVIIDEHKFVTVYMTLTSPQCPEAQTLPASVQQTVRQVEGVSDVAVELVWDPPWTKDLMSEDAKMLLGMF